MALVQVTITIQSDDPSPVPLGDTRFTVQDDAQVASILSGITSQSGVTVFSIEESTTYKLLLSRTLTAFTVPEDLVVAAGPAPQSFTFQGTTSVISPPANPNLCRVYGFLQDLKGSPLAFIAVIAHNLFDVTDINGIGILGSKTDVITDATGRFEMDLVQGATVQIMVQDTDIAIRVEVPAQATANITDLISSATNEIAPPVQG